MNLNIKEMLSGDPVRLRYVNRYSTCRVNHPENVAEHSFYVGLYAMMIATWCSHRNIQISWRLLMCRTMMHDMEESRTGDWPRRFKHSDERMREQLDRVACIAMEQVVKKLTNNVKEQSEWVRDWVSAKNFTPEGCVVAFADFLSVLSYISQEQLSGNLDVLEHVEELDKYYKDFSDARFDFLRPLIDDAGRILEQAFAVQRRSGSA